LERFGINRFFHTNQSDRILVVTRYPIATVVTSKVLTHKVNFDTLGASAARNCRSFPTISLRFENLHASALCPDRNGSDTLPA
jgi:hypothetical protein